MKSRSFRVAVLSAFVLTYPLLSFAAGQPKLHMPGKSQVRIVPGHTRNSSHRNDSAFGK
jgi:hypothetical protein